MNSHLRMLCADDNADLRCCLKEQFVAEEFQVDTAEDGDIALELIKKNQYNIVLLDVKMPRMDGLSVLQEMKKLKKCPHVIMLSAVSDVPTALECVKLGAKDYISKPYDPEELLRVVNKAIGS